MNYPERDKGLAIGKNKIGLIVDILYPHGEVFAARQKIPHERSAMLQISYGMVRHCAPPRRGQSRGAEDFFAFEPLHHELARLEPPIDVPLGWFVTAVQEQLRLGLAPGDRKLILLGEMAYAGEIVDQDRMQRVLADGAKRAVIHHLHQAKQPKAGRDKEYGGALPGELRGPQNGAQENRRCDKGVWPQQQAKREQAE